MARFTVRVLNWYRPLYHTKKKKIESSLYVRFERKCLSVLHLKVCCYSKTSAGKNKHHADSDVFQVYIAYRMGHRFGFDFLRGVPRRDANATGTCANISIQTVMRVPQNAYTVLKRKNQVVTCRGRGRLLVSCVTMLEQMTVTLTLQCARHFVYDTPGIPLFLCVLSKSKGELL